MTLLNKCAFRAVSSGLGDFVVASVLTGAYTPAQCTNPAVTSGAVYSYSAYSDDGTQHEEGSGVYTSGSVTLARTTIASSSNAGAKVNFSAAPQVRLTPLVADIVPYSNGSATLALGTLTDDYNKVAADLSATWIATTNAQNAWQAPLRVSVTPSGTTSNIFVTGSRLAEFKYDGVSVWSVDPYGSMHVDTTASGGAAAITVTNTTASAYSLIGFATNDTPASGYIYVGVVGTGTGLFDAGLALIEGGNGVLISADTGPIILSAGYVNTVGWKVDATGKLLPLADATMDIGSASKQVKDIHAKSATLASGTITASTPTTVTQTWNNAAVAFTALTIDVTRTLYGVNSKLLDIKADGSSVGHVDYSGQFNVTAFQVFDGVDVFNSGIMGTFINIAGARAGLCTYANGTGPALELQIFTDVAKPLKLGANSTLSWIIDSTNNALSPSADDTYDIGNSTELVRKGYFRTVGHKGVAFASLPGSPVAGDVAYVTDSNTATWGATIAGGGANKVLAFYNGTNWTVAGK